MADAMRPIASRLIAMIPARMGSQRLPMKNLAMLGGRPLIAYAIQAAKAAGVFARIVVNSEDERFARIARRYGVAFYQRPARWATSTAKSDPVVYDFLTHHPCDAVAWVNPIAPLQTGDEIRAIATHFVQERLDTLMTVKREQVHCVYRDRPVNFSTGSLFARTQDLEPVLAFVYSVMMWRSDVFRRTFERRGHAFFCGRVGFYPVHHASTIIVKRRDDLLLAQALLKARNGLSRREVRYDRLAQRPVAVRA
jgi:CMP-N-acetylneuraminic acid synthetase